MGSEFRGFRAQGLAGLGVRVEGFRFRVSCQEGRFVASVLQGFSVYI